MANPFFQDDEYSFFDIAESDIRQNDSESLISELKGLELIAYVKSKGITSSLIQPKVKIKKTERGITVQPNKKLTKI